MPAGNAANIAFIPCALATGPLDGLHFARPRTPAQFGELS
jgi:hypothetical protein